MQEDYATCPPYYQQHVHEAHAVEFIHKKPSIQTFLNFQSLYCTKRVPSLLIVKNARTSQVQFKFGTRIRKVHHKRPPRMEYKTLSSFSSVFLCTCSLLLCVSGLKIRFRGLFDSMQINRATDSASRIYA